MLNVHRTHHTRLDSLSVAPYDVKTLFGIDGGPLEMVSDFFPLAIVRVKLCHIGSQSPRVKIPPGNCLMGQIKSQCMGKHDQGPFLLCPSTSSGHQGSQISFFLVAKWPLGENSTDASKHPKSVLTSYGATERESNRVWWVLCTLGISVSLYFTGCATNDTLPLALRLCSGEGVFHKVC